MARLVNPSPPLPYAGSSISVSELARFDGDLVRMLTFYLRDMAERANGSLPKDGSEAMTGALDLGGFGLSTTGPVSTGALTVGGLLTTNGQVAFPATQNPSADANTLDDYREGTWTPSFALGGASVGMTFGSRFGSYVKVGKVCHIIGQMNLSALGSSTGNATITGLPFTVSQNAGASVGLYLNFQASVTGITAIFLDATSTMNLYNLGAGSQSQLTHANFGGGSIVIFGGSYLVA